MSHEDKRNKGREKWHAQSTKRPALALAPAPCSLLPPPSANSRLVSFGHIRRIRPGERAKCAISSRAKARQNAKKIEGDQKERAEGRLHPERLHNFPL